MSAVFYVDTPVQTVFLLLRQYGFPAIFFSCFLLNSSRLSSLTLFPQHEEAVLLTLSSLNIWRQSLLTFTRCRLLKLFNDWGGNPWSSLPSIVSWTLLTTEEADMLLYSLDFVFQKVVDSCGGNHVAFFPQLNLCCLIIEEANIYGSLPSILISEMQSHVHLQHNFSVFISWRHLRFCKFI